MTNTDITPDKLIVNCVNREQYEQAKTENLIHDDEVWVVEPPEQIDGMNKQIINVKKPVEDLDAANKKYVDDSISTLEQGIQQNYQPIGSYLQVGTTLSDLENTPGFQTLGEVEHIVENAPFQPKGDYITTDNDYVTRMEVDDAVNDAKVRRVWNASHNKFIDSDGNIYSIDSEGNETIVDRFTRDSEKSGTVNEIFSQDGKQKIDGDGNVWRNQSGGHWSEWTFSDGQEHTMFMDEYADLGWRWVLEPEYAYAIFGEKEAAENATTVDFMIEAGQEVVATREWVEDGDNWRQVDELALKTDIPTPGISSTECRSIVQSYGYQTATQVNSAITSKGYQTESDVNYLITSKGYQTSSQVESKITSKGYQTESQVNSLITSKGYQTESQVRSIVESAIPSGYVETDLVGTLEDDTEITFKILTKGL